MDSNWASDHLQVIRTIMERSALYRRALAPIMLAVGVMGVAGAVVPCFTPIETNRAFAMYWMVVGILAVAFAYWLARRQALSEDEPFWSPPTRRVTQALAPGLFAGLVPGLLMMVAGDKLPNAAWLLAVAWVVLYGCALHAAGFFMQRGIKLFSRSFVFVGCSVLFAAAFVPELRTAEAAHYVMGGVFGLLHLAYGIYLYFTERRKRS